MRARREPGRPGPAGPRADPERPRHHRRPAGRPARSQRPRGPPARRDPARGRRPGRVDPGEVRRLPDRPRDAAAAADVHADRGARPGDGGARGPSGGGGRPGRAGPRQDRAGPARAARASRGRRTPRPGARLAGRRPGRRGHRRAGAGVRRGPRGSGCATASTTSASGRSSSTRGPWWCGTGGGTSWAGRTARTPAGCCASTGSRRVEVLPERFERPEDLDALAALEEQLSMGWRYDVEVVIDAPVEDCRHWLPRTLRPARGGRRRDDPAGRHHRRAGLVRRAAGQPPVPVPAGRLARGPRGHGGAGPAPARRDRVSLTRPPTAPTGSRPG